MQGPPIDTKPSALVSALMQRPRPSRVHGFPGREDLRIRLMVPADLDESQAKIIGEQRVREEYAKRYKKEPTSDDLSTPAMEALVGDASARELLARCCFEQNPIAENPGRAPQYARIFSDGNQMSQAITSEELSILWFLLLTVRNELGPRTQVLLSEPAVLNMWVSRLRDAGWSAAPLASLAWQDLAELCLFLSIRIDELESRNTSGSEEANGSSLPSSSASSGESISQTSVEPTISFGDSQSTASLGIQSGEALTEDEAKSAAKRLRKPRK